MDEKADGLTQNLNVLAKTVVNENINFCERRILSAMENKNISLSIKKNEKNTHCTLCLQGLCDKTCNKENTLKTPQKTNIIICDPVTPTANLKMLVCAASVLAPAVQDAAEERRNLFGDNKVKTEPYDMYCKKQGLMGRKEKSLGLLCKKFMTIYPEFSENGTTILLDDVVKALGIGRRRVYDIVNVLESMEMMVRQAKNKYLWFGKSRLASTLTKLKALALRVYGANFCNILKRYHHVNTQECNDTSGSKTDSSSDPNNVLNNSDDGEPPVDEVTNTIMDNIISYDMTRRECNRSLGILCQKFIMLFMVTEGSAVTLDRAAKLLITEPDEGPGKYKTKVRRLYDIANILTSINFLEKCVSYEDATRKAAYKWVGINLKSLNSTEATNKAFQTQEFSLTRHSLLSTVPRKHGIESPVKDQLKLRSRSASAHQLTSPGNVFQNSGKSKFPRAFSAATVVKPEVENGSRDDGFDVEKWSTDISSEIKQSSELKDGDSPKESLFKEKLRQLQEEFPDKLPDNGLLELLSACKKKTNEGTTRALRRSLSTDFESECVSPQKKVCTESHKGQLGVTTAPSCNVGNQQASVVPATTFYSALKPLLSYTPAASSSDNVKIVVDTPRDRHVTTVQKWQQPAYLTIPAAFKPGGNQMTGLQSLVVSPIGAPITIAKNGFYHIIPVQCQSLNDQSDMAAVKALPIVINKPTGAVALSTYRPNIPPVTSSVAISPKPIIRRNVAGPVISVSENYPEFVTPPHVLVRNNNVKPQANPIIFPKMTPETPSTSSYSLMNAVTRKLMSFHGEGNP